MARSYSVAVCNAMLDAYEAAIGAAAVLRFYSGSMPANCAAARTGTLLASITLPSNWMADAASGAKALAGSWSGAGVSGAGAGTNIGYFSIFDASGTTCHDQGTVTVTGGGGDMTLDNINIADGQVISISAFALTGIA
jgi:hypothetical protein